MLLRGQNFTGKNCVIPRLAGNKLAVLGGPLLYYFRQQGPEIARLPPDATGKLKDMHDEIARAAVLAIDGDLPLPVDGLVRVEVRRMPKASLHFNDLTETLLANPPGNPAGTREKGKFRRAAHQDIWVLLNYLENGLV